ELAGVVGAVVEVGGLAEAGDGLFGFAGLAGVGREAGEDDVAEVGGEEGVGADVVPAAAGAGGVVVVKVGGAAGELAAHDGFHGGGRAELAHIQLDQAAAEGAGREGGRRGRSGGCGGGGG